MRGTELPIFPLPLVLFPGTPQLLHIFEPRYRQMLADCQAVGRGFGISYVRPGPVDPAPSPGDVGCETRIDAVRPLADGRSNILAVGMDRYRLLHLLRTDRPYRVAAVEPYDDEPAEAEDLRAATADVSSLFLALTHDVSRLDDTAPAPPPLTDDPVALSFRVAAALDLDLDLKQRLLSLRSTGRRLRYLRGALRRIHTDLRRRVRAHESARGNGRPVSEASLGQ